MKDDIKIFSVDFDSFYKILTDKEVFQPKRLKKFYKLIDKLDITKKYWVIHHSKLYNFLFYELKPRRCANFKNMKIWNLDNHKDDNPIDEYYGKDIAEDNWASHFKKSGGEYNYIYPKKFFQPSDLKKISKKIPSNFDYLILSRTPSFTKQQHFNRLLNNIDIKRWVNPVY
ncbi:MAG: hypothetical protein ACOCP8_05355 [archaeon]